MILTIIGLILLLIPFLFLFYFQNKILGFVYILSFLMASHLIISMTTQALDSFHYHTIIAVHAGISIIVILKTKKFIPGFKFDLRKLDWVLIFMVVVVLIHLFSIHHNYSGKYSLATTPQFMEANGMQYPYPYYVDEWYAIAFVKRVINIHSLPIDNPMMNPGWPFVNMQLPFHSSISELVLLLNLDPVKNYTVLTVFSGLLICLLVYLFLVHSGVANISAAIAGLSVLYITNGANLPGIWNLIPLILGIISMLLSFFFVTTNSTKMRILLSAMTLLLYPPLVVFYVIVAAAPFFAKEGALNRRKSRSILYYSLSIIGVGITLSAAYFLAKGSFSDFSNYILFKKLFYPSFTQGFNPNYSIYNILPIPVLLVAIFGIPAVLKRQTWLLVMVSLGIIYWILYSFVSTTVIVEYKRVVVFTSILIVILMGFGLDYLVTKLKKLSLLKKNETLKYIQIGVLVTFLFLSFSYTKRENWIKLTITDARQDKIYMPAAPANQYLQPDDLQLFKNIRNKTFLSIPWKGTVIGVATDNYPVSTKPGTVSMGKKLARKFINSDCPDRYNLVKSLNIDYVYLPQFSCPYFEFLDKSREGLCLYKVLKR